MAGPTTELNTEANIVDSDGFYQALIDAHAGLSDADSRKLNAKLILLLANHIGDGAVLRDALSLARGAGEEA